MADTRHGRIIAFRADRLGARLSSLMNAMRLAETVGVKFACAWTETTGVGDVFNDPSELFDASFVDAHFLTAVDWKQARPAAEVLRVALNDNKAGLSAILHDGTDLIVGNAFGVICLKGEDPDAAVAAYRAQLERILFSPPVIQAMRVADAALQGHTAYHIRRGDLTDDIKAMNKPWPHKMVPNEFYEIHMRKRLEQSGGVVLFSDDADTLTHYQTAFPSIKTVSDVIDSAGLTEAQRDLVELYAMGRCETIIAPERSAFSSTAADLFGSTKLPIAEALGRDLSDRAHEALMKRLAAGPDGFAGEGDIGQSLAHVGAWLEKQGRWEDAVRVFSTHVQGGLNISFVYPKTMTYQHHVDDPDGVLTTADAMLQRHVVHSKDLVNATILTGYAHLRKGHRQVGLKHVVNGFWNEPSGGLSRSVVPVMVELGWLNESNFVPVTPFQRTIGRRRGPVKSLAQDLPGFDKLNGVTLPDSVSRLETMIWDWAPLLQSVSINAAVRTGAVANVIDILERAKAGPELYVELQSQLAILCAFQGDTDTAKEALTGLSQQYPDSWQVWQRLSHVQWMSRAIAPALEAAEMALRGLPNAPAMQAWLGMIQLRNRQAKLAVEPLRSAHEADTGMATFSKLYAQALREVGDIGGALDVIKGARLLAPQDVRAALLEAELLQETGRPHDAIIELQKMVEWQCATARVFILLVDLLQQLDQQPLAAEIARLGAQRFPKHERVVALGHAFAA